MEDDFTRNIGETEVDIEHNETVNNTLHIDDWAEEEEEILTERMFKKPALTEENNFLKAIIAETDPKSSFLSDSFLLKSFDLTPDVELSFITTLKYKQEIGLIEFEVKSNDVDQDLTDTNSRRSSMSLIEKNGILRKVATVDEFNKVRHELCLMCLTGEFYSSDNQVANFTVDNRRPLAIGDSFDTWTPDLIFSLPKKNGKTRIIVFEFSTTFPGNEEMRMQDKINKYKSGLKRRQEILIDSYDIEFYVVVLSSDKLLTNIELIGFYDYMLSALSQHWILGFVLADIARTEGVVLTGKGEEEAKCVALESLFLKYPLKETSAGHMFSINKHWIKKWSKFSEEFTDEDKLKTMQDFNVIVAESLEKDLKKPPNIPTFQTGGTRLDKKRVINHPLLMPRRKMELKDRFPVINDTDNVMINLIAKIFSAARKNPDAFDVEEDEVTLKARIIKNAILKREAEALQGSAREEKLKGVDNKIRNERNRVRVSVGDSERLELAQTENLFGKEHKHNPFVQSEKQKKKKWFHESTNVDDIDDFVNKDFHKLLSARTDFNNLEYLECCVPGILEVLNEHSNENTKMSMKTFKTFLNSELALLCMTSDVINRELSLVTSKYSLTDHGTDFIVQPILNNNAYVISRPSAPGHPVFYTVVWLSDSFYTLSDKSFYWRDIAYTKAYDFSDEKGQFWSMCNWTSVNSRRLDHLLNSLEKIFGLFCLKAESWNCDPSWCLPKKQELSKQDSLIKIKNELFQQYRWKALDEYNMVLEDIENIWDHMAYEFLVYFEGKTITSSNSIIARYPYMESCTQSPLGINPLKSAPSFEHKVRSRLALWMLKRIYFTFTIMTLNPPRLDTQRRTLFDEKLIRKNVQGEKQEESNSDSEDEQDELADDDVEMAKTFEKAQDKWLGLISYVNNKQLRYFSRTLNLMYEGVVHNKEEGVKAHGVKKIYVKILTESNKLYESRLHRMRFGAKGSPNDLKAHEWSRSWVKIACDRANRYLSRKYGRNITEVKKSLKRKYFREVQRQMPEVLATLKASYLKPIEKELNDKSVKMFNKTRKVLEAILDVLKQLKPDIFLFEKLHEILDIYVAQGGVYATLFRKMQIGGDREIFILDIYSRLCALLMETWSRVMCGEFVHEHLTKKADATRKANPHTVKLNKIKRTKDYNTLTCATSGDMTRWCQGFEMTFFAAFIYELADPTLHNVLFTVLNGITTKLEELDIGLLTEFKKNLGNENAKSYEEVMNMLSDQFNGLCGPTTPDSYDPVEISKSRETNLIDLDVSWKNWHRLGKYSEEINEEIWQNENLKAKKPNYPFMEPLSVFIKDFTNMMQGIMQFTSGLTHAISVFAVEELLELIFINMQSKELIDSLVEFIQDHAVNSDDFKAEFSLAWDKSLDVTDQDFIQFLMICARARTLMAKNFCSESSVKKTTEMGFGAIVEFKSNFYAAGNHVTPLIKFVYACLTLKTEISLETRQNIMADLRRQMVENGSSSLLAANVQIGQMLIHYKSLGMGINKFFGKFWRLLLNAKHPILGYFCMEPELYCGYLGQGFAKYLLVNNDINSSIIQHILLKDYSGYLFGEGKYVYEATIQQADNRKWRTLAAKIKDTYGDLAKPESITFFRNPVNCAESNFWIKRKIFSPSSSSSFHWGSTSEMMNMAVYILQNPIFHHDVKPLIYDSTQEETIPSIIERYTKKHSLITIIGKFSEEVEEQKKKALEKFKDSNSKRNLIDFFRLNDSQKEVLYPSYILYDNINEEIEEVKNNYRTVFDRRVKSYKLNVINYTKENKIANVPLKDTILRYWFLQDTLKFSESEYIRSWEMYKLLFPWLKDKILDTLDHIKNPTCPFKDEMALGSFVMGVGENIRSFAVLGPINPNLPLMTYNKKLLTHNISRVFNLELTQTKNRLTYKTHKQLFIEASGLISKLIGSFETTSYINKKIKEITLDYLIKIGFLNVDKKIINKAELYQSKTEYEKQLIMVGLVANDITNKFVLIDMLKSLQKGTFGYYAVTQKKDKLGNWKGTGIYLMVTDTLKWRLSIKDDELIQIEVSDLVRATKYASLISDVVRNMKLITKMTVEQSWGFSSVTGKISYEIKSKANERCPVIQASNIPSMLMTGRTIFTSLDEEGIKIQVSAEERDKSPTTITKFLPIHNIKETDKFHDATFTSFFESKSMDSDEYLKMQYLLDLLIANPKEEDNNKRSGSIDIMLKALYSKNYDLNVTSLETIYANYKTQFKFPVIRKLKLLQLDMADRIKRNISSWVAFNSEGIVLGPTIKMENRQDSIQNYVQLDLDKNLAIADKFFKLSSIQKIQEAMEQKRKILLAEKSEAKTSLSIINNNSISAKEQVISLAKAFSTKDPAKTSNSFLHFKKILDENAGPTIFSQLKEPFYNSLETNVQSQEQVIDSMINLKKSLLTTRSSAATSERVINPFLTYFRDEIGPQRLTHIILTNKQVHTTDDSESLYYLFNGAERDNKAQLDKRLTKVENIKFNEKGYVVNKEDMKDILSARRKNLKKESLLSEIKANDMDSGAKVSLAEDTEIDIEKAFSSSTKEKVVKYSETKLTNLEKMELRLKEKETKEQVSQEREKGKELTKIKKKVAFSNEEDLSKEEIDASNSSEGEVSSELEPDDEMIGFFM